jgi:glycosyltransferase involved in cell wall biosynthesis
MKILFVCKISPLKEGGAETRTKEVAFRLARMGHEVTVLCARGHIDDEYLQRVNGVTIICKDVLPGWLLKRFPYPSYFLLASISLFLMFPLLSLLRKEKYDLIREDFAPFPPSGLLALVKLSGARRVAVAHNLSSDLKGWVKYYGYLYGLAGYVMDRLLRSGRLKFDRIICAGKWFADEMKRHSKIADRVCYVPNGVNLDEFGDAPKERIGNGAARLLCVGRLVETKGFRYAIEALGFLKREYPHLRLDILGNGPLKESLKRLAAERGVSEMLSFRAPVSHAEMPAVYREYDFFLMPSLFEGLPVALIEAMASRLPIVATDIPAITGILDPGSATFATREDGADLAEKLKWAIQHPADVARGAESAYRIAQGYDWEQTALREIEGA